MTMQQPEPAAPVDPGASGLPPLWRGRRRRWIAGLVGLGLLQAVLAMVSAWALIRLGEVTSGTAIGLAMVTLVLVALGVGALRVHERVLAERLGQHYVRAVRRRLLTSALTPGDPSSLGITVARSTNDLTSIRNWIAQGIAPLVVAVPLLSGAMVGLAILDWRLAAAIGVPLALLALGMFHWSREAYARSRALRRTRGMMASRIAETVIASDAILAAGGGERELRNIRSVSVEVADRSVHRAETVGQIRAASTVAATLSGLGVAALGVVGGLNADVVVAAMAIAGIAAAPIMDLGRVVEFRQSFLAARAVLGPALADADRRREAQQRHRERIARLTPPPADRIRLRVPGLIDVPIVAQEGDRVHLVGDRDAVTRSIRRILGLDLPGEHQTDEAWVLGESLAAVDPKVGRALVGYAPRTAALERGRILRAVRYRRPDLPEADAAEVLESVGLTPDQLPDGYRTKIRRGGEPLTRMQVRQVVFARALYGTPPLLIVDGVEADLGEEDWHLLVRLLRDYPGMVLLASSPRTAAALAAREVAVSTDGAEATPAPAAGDPYSEASLMEDE